MTLYITDNPEINKRLQGNSFLIYQIYDWRVKIIDNEEDSMEESLFELKKRFKSGKLKKELKLNDKIIAIVAPSNYKLIYDLIHMKTMYNKELILYSWDSWFNRRRLKIDKKEIKDKFNQYIQRGYLTKIIYSPLSYFNLQRIEQFIALVSMSAADKIMTAGNISGLTKNINYSIDPTFQKVDTLGLIRILCKNGYSVRKAIDKLIYHSRKLDITDPFLGSCEFLTEKSSLKKIFLAECNTDSYFGRDNEYNKDNSFGISLIVELMRGYIPLTDILKTLRFLEKNELITTINKKGSLASSYNFTLEETKSYLKYISKESWQSAYKTNTFIFGGLFPSIDIIEDTYECPLCGSTELRFTPKHFYCSDIQCKLYVHRIINPGGIKKPITENEFIRLIKHGNTIIKNKIGGYNRFFLIREDDSFKIKPQIEKNTIEEY